MSSSCTVQSADAEPLGAVIIGAGQAGLALGYFLQRRAARFLLLEAGPEIGHSWRNRWDSLRLFSPAQYDSLPGLPFPAPRDSHPGKDAVADYLQVYARHFDLPVRLNWTRSCHSCTARTTATPTRCRPRPGFSSSARELGPPDRRRARPPL